MKKIFVLSLIFSCAVIFAESSDTEEEIALPEVSTVISGGALKAGKSAIPDFSEVLPQNETQEIVPQMADAREGEITTADSAAFAEMQEKTIYGEGVAGLGYPGFFIGDFSIYRQTGNNPFKIAFSHETANGYSGKSLTSGFFDRNTLIEAEKTFSTKKTKWILSGKYQSLADGLQGQCEEISDVAKDNMGADFSFAVNFNEKINLKTQVDGKLYKRYGNIVKDLKILDPTDSSKTSDVNTDFYENASVFCLDPDIVLGFLFKKFYFDIGLKYDLQSDFDKSLSNNNANRGEFSFLFGWKNENTNLYSKVGAVIGNNLGDNNIIVPFSVSADLDLPSKISSRNIKISLSGGIDSYLPKVSVLETEYKFSALSIIPNETTFAFGFANISLPIKDVFTLKTSADFKTTVFDNGFYRARYKDDSFKFGQYLFELKNMTQFNTDIAFTFKRGIFTLLAQWSAFWIDNSTPYAPHQIKTGIFIQDKKSRFIIDSSIAFNLGEDYDFCPVLNAEFLFKLSKVVSLSVLGNDLIKLIGNMERDYHGEYIQRSGGAAVLFKFFF